MDDVFERMQIFRSALQRFQDSLEASHAALAARHGTVDPHWQDEARRDYELHYGPLREMLIRYLAEQGPEYLDFLEIKLRAIDCYLNGK